MAKYRYRGPNQKPSAYTFHNCGGNDAWLIEGPNGNACMLHCTQEEERSVWNYQTTKQCSHENNSWLNPSFESAVFAAWKPHIPCTPPPGGVDDEQM
jgi:hypothetical protein